MWWYKYEMMIHSNTCIYMMCIDMHYLNWHMNIESAYRTCHMHIMHSYDDDELKRAKWQTLV